MMEDIAQRSAVITAVSGRAKKQGTVNGYGYQDGGQLQEVMEDVNTVRDYYIPIGYCIKVFHLWAQLCQCCNHRADMK